jgi:hypothetical protein
MKRTFVRMVSVIAAVGFLMLASPEVSFAQTDQARPAGKTAVAKKKSTKRKASKRKSGAKKSTVKKSVKRTPTNDGKLTHQGTKPARQSTKPR